MADFWGDALNALQSAWNTFIGGGQNQGQPQQKQSTQQGRGSAARRADDAAARARAREQYGGESAATAYEDLMSRLNEQRAQEPQYGQAYNNFGQFANNYNAEAAQTTTQDARQVLAQKLNELFTDNNDLGEAPKKTEPTSIYNATPLQLLGLENSDSIFAPRFQRSNDDSIFKQSVEQQREQLEKNPETNSFMDALNSFATIGERSNDLNKEAEGWSQLAQPTQDADINEISRGASQSTVDAINNTVQNLFPLSEAAANRDEFENQQVGNGAQALRDAENNEIQVLPDNQLESNMAVLREANPDFQPYQSMADWQTNGTRDEWHTVMFDPRLAEKFANSFSYYTPNEEDRNYLVQNITNLANDERARELAEAAFNTMWDTQKAYDYEQFYSGTDPNYSLERYNLIFDPVNGKNGILEWTDSQGLAPAVAFPGEQDPNQKIVGLATLGDLYTEYLRNGAGLTQRGEYDNPTRKFLLPFIQSDQEQIDSEDTALDADEQLALNYALNNYVLGLRALDNSDNQAAARLAATDQNWLDTTFALDPHRFVSQKDLSAPDMQSKLTNHQIWQIQPGESFQEQNPTYGNTTYAGEYSTGDNYTDLDAIRRYNVPVMGADQLLANLGYYMADKDAF